MGYDRMDGVSLRLWHRQYVSVTSLGRKRRGTGTRGGVAHKHG